MQTALQFTRSFVTRASVCDLCMPYRKIMDRYQKGVLNKKRVKEYLDSITHFISVITRGKEKTI